MPLPKPNDGESQKEFIGRCMLFQDKEKDLTNEATRKQALAMCYSQWDRKDKLKEEKTEFKTFAEIVKENQ